MMIAKKVALVSAVVLGAALAVNSAAAQEREIDTLHSVIKLRVLKSGFFSAFGHNHEIAAKIVEGQVHLGVNPAVAIKVRTSELRVIDSDASPKDREDIQTTMLGPKVLDVERFPEISFQSTGAEQKGEQHWTVRGKLGLHGKTSPVEVAVAFKNDHYQGSCELRQHDFGIAPVTVAGGTVKVKDEVKVEFDIVLK